MKASSKEIARRRKAESGTAVLFLLPFRIHAANAPVRPRVLYRDKVRFRIYWPHVNEGGKAPTLPQINLLKIPFPPGVPGFEGYTPPSFIPTWHTNWKADFCVADALRVDVYDDKAAEDAASWAAELFGIFRWYTGQWWIGRDNRFEEPIDRNGLGIDGLGAPAGTITAKAGGIGFGAYARLLDEERFVSIVQAFERGTVIPLYWQLFFDAHYHHATLDSRRFVLDLSNACEADINAAVNKSALERGISAKILRRRMKRSDLMYNVDAGLKELIGTSFVAAEAVAGRKLAEVWRMRNNIAHGVSSEWRREVFEDPTDGGIRIEALHAGFRLLAMLGLA